MDPDVNNKKPNRELNRMEIDKDQLLKLQQLSFLGSYVGSYLHEERALLSSLSMSLTSLFHYCRQKHIRIDRIDRITEIVETIRHHHDAFVSLYRWDRDESTLVQLEEVFLGAINMLRSAFFHQDIEIFCEIDRNCRVAMVADPHLRVVLVNLLSNAAQALSSQGNQVKHVKLIASKCNNKVKIDVIDNGPGIPANMRPHIWDIGFSTKADYPGVGLAIVKEIVDLYSGNVWEDGTLGEGSAFHVVFPAQWRPDA